MTLPLAPIYRAAEVRRWHQNPAMARHVQTNADHQGRCVQLLLMLNPMASRALIHALAFHDVGEAFAGDLSGPFKRAHPEVAAAHAKIEAEARQRISGPDPVLDPIETQWLGFIDKLDAAAFTVLHNPTHAARLDSGWSDALSRLREHAHALGVGPAVFDFINDLFGGAT